MLTQASSVRAETMTGRLLAAAREYRGLSADEVDSRAGAPSGTCLRYEASLDVGPAVSALLRLARFLGIRVADLVSPTGYAADCVKGQCGPVARTRRRASGFTPAEVARACDLTVAEYLEIESGASSVELYLPDLLRLAEALDIPLYDLLEEA